MIGQNRFWLPLLPPRHSTPFWTPSLYLGGATLVLALAAAGFRAMPPWGGWITAIALGSFGAALGEYGSPPWWAPPPPGAELHLGGHDMRDRANAPRADGTLRDGDGGFYWLLATALPGFRLFRYPGKLLTFTSLALSALAGLGWTQAAAREGPRR